LISRCFSALKMMNADLNRLGASGAFFIFPDPPSPFFPLPPPVAGGGAPAATAATTCCWATSEGGICSIMGKGMVPGAPGTPYP
jgi:hypothetical protein